jgi:hypothetical protein
MEMELKKSSSACKSHKSSESRVAAQSYSIMIQESQPNTGHGSMLMMAKMYSFSPFIYMGEASTPIPEMIAKIKSSLMHMVLEAFTIIQLCQVTQLHRNGEKPSQIM